ncbi:MAG: protein kinase domain-containing protein, partial [Anaerolineae bacterium]
MNNLVGQKFGPYEITAKIGEGGMAVVYKGYQQSLNRYVAIKVLRAELAQDKEFVERFRREALSVADLSHPNILHVYDAGFSDGVYYIVMAFVDGGSLKEMIMRGPLDMDYAISVVAQMADALHHAHQHGLVHRDVKPNNILMTRDGRPLLTDFGIAKAVHESTGLTRTGTSIGTPEYMAPEQIQGQKVDARTDIYALGIVLYESLTGWTPFSTTTPVATLYKQVNEPPPPLRQANINIPVWLEDV